MRILIYTLFALAVFAELQDVVLCALMQICFTFICSMRQGCSRMSHGDPDHR